MDTSHLPTFRKLSHQITLIESMHPKTKQIVEEDLKELYLKNLLGDLNECIYENVVSYNEAERKYTEVHKCLKHLFYRLLVQHPEWFDEFLKLAEIESFRPMHLLTKFKNVYVYRYRGRRYYLKRLYELDSVLPQYYE